MASMTEALRRPKLNKKKQNKGPPEMRSSLNNRNAPAARQLDKYLSFLTSVASMVTNMIREVDSLVVAKVVVKTKLYASLVDVKRAELRVVAAERERPLEERAEAAKNSIATINCDYDDMVAKKEAWLADAHDN
ncbi:hypothetical protein Adt_35272 [Abeliophyllum distichum]|uniref:Uncharacterized protein n=1 Tax=Abeliophyllum distichum TaxID=126358 RepID=A0ABD1QI95_9LAMI